MELSIQRLNDVSYYLTDYGISTLDFQVDAPSPRPISEIIEGRDGVVDLGATYDARQMRGSFFMKTEEDVEFTALRNDIFRIFAGREQFYLIDSREPNRRWLVRTNGFSVEQIVATKGRFEVDFTAARPYAESIAKSIEIPTAIITGGRTVKYVHNTATFEIFNDSDVAINPRELPLVITFAGASTDLRIENITTGDAWAYTGTTSASDDVKLDGIRSTKNGLSIFRDTNRKLITLAPGWNDFTITGATAPFEITFDFRYYTI
jgi:phage-related protein